MDKRDTMQEIVSKETTDKVAGVLVVERQVSREYSRYSILVIDVRQVFISYKRKRKRQDQVNTHQMNKHEA